ncbi:Oligo-1,6-glucosidase 1 [Lactobacillus helveticus]|nr:Oligo-1,6-glucosidase 1 [Lactobacillus helveticus]NRO76623.1 Oligo-1,6-glucosidase 1 [Lactobacillus helveticus]
MCLYLFLYKTEQSYLILFELYKNHLIYNFFSKFNTYRRLIQLRHDHENILEGTFKIYKNHNQNVLSYLRQSGNEKCLIVANLSAEKQLFSSDYVVKTILISNYNPRNKLKKIILKPYEAFVVSVN